MDNKLSLQKWADEATARQISFGQLCLELQAEELDMSVEAMLDHMEGILEVMSTSIQNGLTGKPSRSELVGGGARKMQLHLEEQPEGQLVGTVMARAITIALAVAESNACMGRIVAAPTAGSSGVLPAVLFSLGESKGWSRRQLAIGLVTAGAIGMVIASRSTLSGAEGGCQAECGAAGAMAAGAVVDLCGGTPAQVCHAVAITLKNMLGLVCDPVGGLVEVPCVKRNVGAVAQSLVAAEMVLAGIESVIPADEVIDTMASIGHALPASLKETSQGGLAVTPTGKAIARRLCGPGTI